MLGNDALSQLKALKTEIRSTKDFFEGEVVPSSGKFGFIIVGEDRHFLPPTEMERVLPGDEVKFCLVPGRDDQQQAELDSIVKKSSAPMFGTYQIRNNNHFIDVSFGRSSRWLFVPPAKRKNHEDGELVQASLIRHPFKTGKAAVEVAQSYGLPSAPWAKQAFIAAKYALTQLPDNIAVPAEPAVQRTLDLTDIPFVTIDSASTRDIDDALFAKATEHGFELKVAIADASAWVTPGSELDTLAMQRGTTVYLPGRQLSMLPSELATDRCSLIANENRSALVITLTITADGECTDSNFEFAQIKSHAKLSYAEVANYYDNATAIDASDDLINASLDQLKLAQEALLKWRSEHCIMMDDRNDYYYEVDSDGHLVTTHLDTRNSAHRVVEECMLAANRAAGELLEANNTGLFSSHAGFRPERQEAVELICEEQKPELNGEFGSLEHFVSLMQSLRSKETNEKPLVAPLTRMLQPGQITPEANPHFGLGFNRYATITSPIRKYQDLVNHRCIAAIIENQTCTLPSQELGEKIQLATVAARRASSDVEQWLSSEFYGEHLKGQTTTARVAMINSGGLAVQLIETGCEGFVDLRKQRPSFDPNYMTLEHQETTYVLEQFVDVKVTGYDKAQSRLTVELA